MYTNVSNSCQYSFGSRGHAVLSLPIVIVIIGIVSKCKQAGRFIVCVLSYILWNDGAIGIA